MGSTRTDGYVRAWERITGPSFFKHYFCTRLGLWWKKSCGLQAGTRLWGVATCTNCTFRERNQPIILCCSHAFLLSVPLNSHKSPILIIINKNKNFQAEQNDPTAPPLYFGETFDNSLTEEEVYNLVKDRQEVQSKAKQVEEITEQIKSRGKRGIQININLKFLVPFGVQYKFLIVHYIGECALILFL